jgi:hypothetical protein
MVGYSAVNLDVKAWIESWYSRRIPLLYTGISVMVKTFSKWQSSFYDVSTVLCLRVTCIFHS